jgi:ABC-type transport system substrate-binding protein
MDIKELASSIDGKGFNDAKRILDASGYKWRGGVYVGQVKGQAKGKPTVVGTYHTMNHGELQTVTKSMTNVGEKDERGFTCIVNNVSGGDAHMPDTYWWYAVEI